MGMRFVVLCGVLALLPVAAHAADTGTKPVVVQTGESSIQTYTYRDCLITQSITTRFTPVKLNSRAAPEPLNLMILRETLQRDDQNCWDGVDGKITVAATSYDPDFKAGKAAWSFTSPGWTGEAEPDGHWSLYRVSMPGCCGASDTDTYFSLWNGKRLFMATGPILSALLQGIQVGQPDMIRFIGLFDNASAQPEEFKKAAHSDDAIAVLYLTSDREPGESLVIHGHKDDAYHYGELSFLMQGKPMSGTELDLIAKKSSDIPKGMTGFSVHGKLECECERPDLEFEVPVVGGHLDLKNAKSKDPAVSFTLGSAEQ